MHVPGAYYSPLQGPVVYPMLEARIWPRNVVGTTHGHTTLWPFAHHKFASTFHWTNVTKMIKYYVATWNFKNSLSFLSIVSFSALFPAISRLTSSMSSASSARSRTRV